MAEEESDMENMNPEQIAQLQRENCIFCKIIAGDIPSKRVYEDQDFVGILDINPASDGHVLLLPKQHHQIMPQIPPELVGSLGVACSAVSAKILKGFKCEGTSVFIANGAVAGQRAPHFMVHIIPRTEGDNIFLNPALNELEDDVFESMKVKITTSMRVSPDTRARKPDEDEAGDKNEKKKSKERSREKKNKDDKNDSAGESSSEEEDTDTNDKPRDTDEDNDKHKITAPKKSVPKKKAPEKTGTPTPSRNKTDDKVDYDKLGRLFG